MNKSSHDKLDSLVEKLSVKYLGNQNVSTDDFIAVEKRLSTKIPEDYQYFCHILGAGRLDDFVDIFYMDSNRLDESIATAEYMINKINQYIAIRGNYESQEGLDWWNNRDNNGYIKLLESALIFGGYNGEVVIFWDLRTYNSDDDSFDIYWYDLDMPDEIDPIKIGRNFTDFICDFCYGQMPCNFAPGITWNDNIPRIVNYTFYGLDYGYEFSDSNE
jgi:SMI1 / KNR4 family (SUKH-1)